MMYQVTRLSVLLLFLGNCTGSPFEPALEPLYPQMVDFYSAEAREDFESVYGYLDPAQHYSDSIQYKMDDIRKRREELGSPELLGCSSYISHKYHSRGRRVDAQCFAIRNGTVYREHYVMYAAYPSRDKEVFPLPFYISQVTEIEPAGFQGQVAREKYGEMRPTTHQE